VANPNEIKLVLRQHRVMMQIVVQSLLLILLFRALLNTLLDYVSSNGTNQTLECEVVMSSIMKIIKKILVSDILLVSRMLIDRSSELFPELNIHFGGNVRDYCTQAHIHSQTH